MEFGIIFVLLMVGLFVARLSKKSLAPVDQALQHLAEGSEVRAEVVVEAAFKSAVQRHGAQSVEAGQAGIDLARILLLVGDRRRSRDTIDAATAVLRAHDAPTVVDAVAQLALHSKVGDPAGPAFADLDWLTPAQLATLGPALTRAVDIDAIPAQLGEVLLREGQAFIAAADPAAASAMADDIAEAARRAALAPLLAQQAVEAAEAASCGRGGGGCGSCGPKGVVDPEASRLFAEVIASKVPAGVIKAVEMRREGDVLTPRVIVARTLDDDEQKHLTEAVRESMGTVQERMAAPAPTPEDGGVCRSH